MTYPVRFGYPFTPSREWTEAWEEAYFAYFRRLLSAYRDRVEKYWQLEYRQMPGTFALFGSVEVVAVATLSAAWIFVRPATVDTFSVIEHWEHEQFADWEFMHMPKDHRARAVALAFLEGVNWTLHDEREIAGSLEADTVLPQFAVPEEDGVHQADADAAAVQFEQAIKGELLDHDALARVRGQLETLERSTNRQARGRQFEGMIEALLEAHGCHVERGLPGESEQVDLFMTDPEWVLIECRWEGTPLEPEVIYNITGKLAKRPSFVNGLYVSMSGFTEGAKTESRNTRNRTVVLMERDDVLTLANGDITFKDFWQAYLRDLLVRRPST